MQDKQRQQFSMIWIDLLNILLPSAQAINHSFIHDGQMNTCKFQVTTLSYDGNGLVKNHHYLEGTSK